MLEDDNKNNKKNNNTGREKSYSGPEQ